MKQRKDTGVAGLTILLSLVTILFVIGLLVMIFAIMSSKMADTDTLYTSETRSVVAEAYTPSTTGQHLSAYGLRNVVCTITAVTNGTAGGTLITSGNYTQSPNCNLKNTTSTFSTAGWKVNFTYTFDADSSGAVGVMNDTTSSIVSVTDWFDIFIVIGAMVVLILLTVVIITAIRSSGMVDGAGRPNNVGTA